MKAAPAALGFRVKSGWATAVLLAGPRRAPRVVDRRIAELSDPAVPEARQPFHAGLGRHDARAAKSVARLVRAVERFAHRSVAKLIAEYRATGHRIRGVGIVVGSTIDPVAIANEHIRAHAEEGRLFRTVIETAAGKSRLRAQVTPEKQLYASAAQVLRTPVPRLKARVAALGEQVVGSWRSEDKAAAVAAWMVL
ncbi:MAG TPA: hypothetical protein VGQ06_08745 [Gemmatimonadales bacterium]|nr:hypothetical protein [Gemmatimonadales bacterium]